MKLRVKSLLTTILCLCIAGCSLLPKIIPDELGGNHNKKVSVNAMAQQGDNSLLRETIGDRTGNILIEPREGWIWVYFADNSPITVHYHSYDKSKFGYGISSIIWAISGVVLILALIFCLMIYRRKK